MNLNILLLGLTSLITDASSEMIAPILPMFIASLGGSALAIGLIGGLGDCLAALLNVLSGWFSDKIGKRRAIVGWGYGLSAIAKLLYPVASSWASMLLLRPLERVGKGIRDAPRDAIIARSMRISKRGKGFGVHRALDTLGAILGSILAFLLIWTFALGFQPILWLAAVIAFFALIPLIWVKDVPTRPVSYSLFKGIAKIPTKAKAFIAVSGIFGLANFTYMLFIIRAQAVFPSQFSILGPIGLYIIFNLVYAMASIPAGMLSDKFGRKYVIALGWATFAIVCLGFSFTKNLILYAILFALYGLSFAFTVGNQRAYVADLSANLKGTGLGLFHTATAFATLIGSIIAGVLWQAISPEFAFLYGLALAIVALIGLVKC